MKCFEMTHLFIEGHIVYFNEETVPDWLSSVNTIKGSTIDNRWFYNDHVLTLEVGAFVDTDFRRIKRVL